MLTRFPHKLFALCATTCIVASCNSANGQNLSKSIVRVQGSAMPGSGVVVRHNGNLATVWTVAHVIGNPKGSVEITEANGRTTQAKIISYSKEKDIAILEFKPTKQYGNIKTVNANPEEDVTVIGFPNRLNLNSNKPEAFNSPSFIFGQWDNSKQIQRCLQSNNSSWHERWRSLQQSRRVGRDSCVKDIRQDETTFCYGGKLKDKGPSA